MSILYRTIALYKNKIIQHKLLESDLQYELWFEITFTEVCYTKIISSWARRRTAVVFWCSHSPTHHIPFVK